MDEINEFFDINLQMKPVRLEGPSVSRLSTLVQTRSRSPPSPAVRLGTEYVIAERELGEKEDTEEHKIHELDEMECEDDSEEEDDFYQAIYHRFNFIKETRQTFAIDKMKSQIQFAVASQQVTIIEGPTGCGKTTQVPQWILEDRYQKGQPCRIIVTQPRRIAAITVAKRVCDEYDCEMGSLVGYRIGLEKKVSKTTLLQYVTTVVLLQELINSKSLKNYTHIVLDEVHERDIYTDFLITIIRKLLKHDRKGVKVILMSATFDVERFSEYFSVHTKHGYERVPVISLTEKTPHLVKIWYLNDLAIIGKLPQIEKDVKFISQESYETALRLLNCFEEIDKKEEIEDLQDQRPSVLIFLPGLHEIEELYQMLNCDIRRQKIDPHSPLHKWYVLPLHSCITNEEQIKAFKKPPSGYRKIILATNIAESSITVPDIKYVIDYCLCKVHTYNSITGFTSLELSWASKANCVQRAGRAGRVRSGRVYRLVPENFYDSLCDTSVPEIQRHSLQSLILLIKLLNMGSPKHILGLAMDPPDLTNIRQSILSLKEIGALYRTSENMGPDDGNITYLGTIMAKLPIDLKVTKLIMLGYMFGCLQDCIIIAAALSVKSVFSTPFLSNISSYNTKLTWAHGSTSDHLALLHVYKVFERLKRTGNITLKKEGVASWAKSMFLQYHALLDMSQLITELKMRLSDEGIDEFSNESPWNDVEHSLILKILVAGAFYPNYFVISFQNENEEREANKVLNGKDPYDTIYFTNMDHRLPGDIYSSQIKTMLTNCSTNMDIEFDYSSNKIFVTFPPNISQEGKARMPGRVALPVYQSIKMRKSKIPFVLHVMPEQESWMYAARVGMQKPMDLFNTIPSTKKMKILPRLPGIDESYIKIKICFVNNCGHFWARIDDISTMDELKWINNTLNNSNICLYPLKSDPIQGNIYAAPFYDVKNGPHRYYRARIDYCVSKSNVMVFFIDYGNSCEVHIDELRELPRDIRQLSQITPISFECILAEIAPSIFKDSRGLWSEEANKRFLNLIQDKVLHGKVYSVVNSVVSLELLVGSININDLLLKEGFAQISEESYASKLNKDLRNQAFTFSPSDILLQNEKQAAEYLKTKVNYPPPKKAQCTRSIHLKGPYSPLETSAYSLFNSERGKSITINNDSVNSILLNTDSRNCNERLIVATEIHEGYDASSYKISNTTMMPNITGILPLMALMFSPVAELKCDEHQTRYNGILCGLGHINGRPIYPEHDMRIHINCEITNDDIETINHLRQTMNYTFMTKRAEMPQSNLNMIMETPRIVKKVIQKLIPRQRRRYEYSPIIDSWDWNTSTTGLVVENILSDLAIFAIHSGSRLYPPSKELKNQLLMNNKTIKSICERSCVPKESEYECKICCTGMLNIQSLRLHLQSRMHRDNEPNLYEDS